jgi:hypothetical protein
MPHHEMTTTRLEAFSDALSGALYLLAVPLAYVSVYASFFIFVLIPAMYFLPEKKLAGEVSAFE